MLNFLFAFYLKISETLKTCNSRTETDLLHSLPSLNFVPCFFSVLTMFIGKK